MKKLLIILGFLLTSLIIHAQSNDFVYIKDNKFKLGCEDFYPRVINYIVDIKGDSTSGYYVSPHGAYFTNYSINSETDAIARLRAHMAMIKTMGFNTMRVCGLQVFTDSICASSKLFTYYQCCKKTQINSPYVSYFNLIEEFLNIAKEFDMKIILLTGGGHIQDTSVRQKYGDYLNLLTKQLSGNKSFFAIDLYNEPYYDTYINMPTFSKSEIYQMISYWYQSIRQNSTNPLVTIGLTRPREALFDWDHGIMKVDFISWHFYAFPPETYNENLWISYIKWYSATTNKPWIIGETGYSSNDSLDVHPHANGTNLQQKDFAKKTLAMTRDCGGKGYSWWQYQDVHWYPDDSIQSVQNYFGLMNHYSDTSFEYNGTNYTVQGLWKPAVQEIKSFNFNNTGTCPSYSLINYYKPENYTNIQVTGEVVDINENPIPNAIIIGWKQLPDFSEMEFRTFSKSDGSFNLYTDANIAGPIIRVKISYPGYSIFNLNNWNYSFPITAELINLNYNTSTSLNSDFVIGSGQDIIWASDMNFYKNVVIETGGQIKYKCNYLF